MPPSDEHSLDTARFPTDLLIVVVLVLVTDAAVFLPLVRETPLRIVFGIPFLLFLPGYALVAALFPELGSDRASERNEESSGPLDPGPSIGLAERVVFSVGTSLIVVPLVGFLLNFTSYGVRAGPVVVVVSVVVVALAAIGALRRRSLAPADRFTVPLRSALSPLRADSAHLWANALIVVGLVVALSGLGYALTAPSDESYTEFYLATQNGSGEYVTSGFPRNFTVGESKPVTAVVANHRGSPTEYTMVVLTQRVRPDGEGTEVVEEVEESRETVRVGTDEVSHRRVSVAPSIQGDDLRLTFLLYVGEPPAEPTAESATHTLYLWVDVTGADDGGSARLTTR